MKHLSESFPLKWDQLWDPQAAPYDTGLWEQLSAPWDLLSEKQFNRILSQPASDRRQHRLQLQPATGLLTQDQLFHNGEFKQGRIRVEASQRASKGDMRCYLNDQLLRGASYLQAGVYLASSESAAEIWLGDGCYIQSGAYLEAPIVLGPNCEVRQGAYIRGGVIAGSSCLIGHCSELKHVIMHNQAKAPHFAYVGDSILGSKVNLGAGTKVSNLKITGTEVVIRHDGKSYPTGMRKLGGILGDGVETGCNAVLNPGVILGKACAVYPAMAVAAGIYHPKTWILPEKRK